MIPAIEHGFPQSEIAAASYRYQREVEAGERIIVGVNRVPGAGRRSRSNCCRSTRRPPDSRSASWRRCGAGAIAASGQHGRWTRCKRAAGGTENTMPYILDAVRAYATLGEICDALRDVFGSYEESAVI